MTTPTECVTNTININREEIPKSNCIKNLGGWVDAVLSFKTHITQEMPSSNGKSGQNT